MLLLLLQLLPLKVLCGDLSGGNKRKVCTAVSLVSASSSTTLLSQTGRPDLVLMDEPTTGLDPGSKRQVRTGRTDTATLSTPPSAAPQVWSCIRAAVGSGQSVLLPHTAWPR